MIRVLPCHLPNISWGDLQLMGRNPALNCILICLHFEHGLLSTPVHVCYVIKRFSHPGYWLQAIRYFDVEERQVKLTRESFVLTPEGAEPLIDENTIGDHLLPNISALIDLPAFLAVTEF